MTTSELATRNGSGTEITRQGFGEVERRNETAATALATQARAETEARYVMALQRPRNDDDVRVRLIRECKRPRFAERAYYSIPRKGAKPGRLTGTPGRVEGLSVRFAEAVIRLSGNILQSTRTTYDDDFKRMVNVAATDLERNAVYSRDIVIEKTVERREPRDGEVVLGQRQNTTGDTVFIIQCTESELLVKESALVSRMFRTEALRLLPADTLDECEQEIIKTVRAADKDDPEAARKRLADAFAALGIMPSDLASYLGHDLAQCSPAELTDLRGLYSAVRDGEASWSEIVGEKGKPPEEQVATAKVKKLTEKVRGRTAAKAVEAPAATAPPAQGPTPGTDAPPAAEPEPATPSQPGQQGELIK